MGATSHTIRRFHAIALVASLGVALTACSTLQSLSGIPRPGYQKDGTYVLSAEEQALGCRQLQERSMGLQEHLQSLSTQAVKQMQALPDTIAAAWGRMVGTPAAAPALAEYTEAHAEQIAFNEAMSEKGCGSPETASIKR
ncbi:MAG: hypothetical protein M5U16_05490 [Hyphomicrobium sp.]|nr:hypothetical protein [Hyphomicrobium sp.]